MAPSVEELRTFRVLALIRKYRGMGHPHSAIAGLYQEILDGSDVRLLEAINQADSEVVVNGNN